MIALDRQSIRRRIAERFDGTVARVTERWPGGSDPPHRSTILRWLHGQTLPRCQSDLLAFAGALDLDPFALWHINSATFAALCNRMRAAAWTGAWSGLLPTLSFLDDFLRPSQAWPPPQLAEQYFGRDWARAEHRHKASERRDYFKTFSLQPGRRQKVGGDQVWHFAWRPSSRAEWRPYGFVRHAKSELRLYSFGGTVAEAELAAGAGFCVETWIGQGPAEFRIASLHPFAMAVIDDGGRCGARVRFA